MKMLRLNVRRYGRWFMKVLILFLLASMGTYITLQFIDEASVEKPKLKKEEQLKISEIPQKDDLHRIRNVPQGQKDWHNYQLIEAETHRTGPGENGQAYELPKEVSREKEALFRVNGFNARASDDIALNRSIKDIRHPKCRELTYLEMLPTVSVVVPFHNEHWSTLLRTVYSIINRSPAELLLEVILVDDASTKEFLQKQLDDYVMEKLPKVKVIHLQRRAGLIRARLAGAKAAKGDVLIFLDSHSESNTNWLPPLLDPIAKDYRTCVCPFIDVIDYETFAYRAQDEGARGAFDWQLFYKRLPLLQKDLDNMPHPFKSPVMAGGLFAISSKFFWELGGYDPGLDIWGGEQYELSFKIWQCGGQMLDAPCSRIGHIYRKFAPFSSAGAGDYLGRNYKRVAEVWMDEYAEYVYKHSPRYRNIVPGNLDSQRAIRKKLNCKPFKWFMTEVAFDLMKVYPPVEPPDFANGTVKSVANPELCVDTRFKQHEERFGLKPCKEGGEQVFHLTWHKDIRPSKRNICWDVSSGVPQAPVLLYHCHGGGGNQLWKYDPVKQHLIHGGNPRCLDSNPGSEEIFVSVCSDESLTQKWIFERYDQKRLEYWDREPVL